MPCEAEDAVDAVDASGAFAMSSAEPRALAYRLGREVCNFLAGLLGLSLVKSYYP